MECNIYCDESCHLENDGINVMVLGGIWCPSVQVKNTNAQIADIKKKHNVFPQAEVKWTKVAPCKTALYADLVDYFFSNDNLHFRGLLVPDKGILNHEKFRQTHDDWYYKMYFDMLKIVLDTQDIFNIYIDIKDNHSHAKAQTLMKVCRNAMHDFSGDRLKRVQPIRSHEVQIIQLADILIGAIGYRNRHFEHQTQSAAKLALIRQIERHTGHSLSSNTYYKEKKFNLLVWEPRAVIE